MIKNIKKFTRDKLTRFNKFLDNYKKHIFIDILAIIFTGIFITAGILISIHRFWQYEVFYYNFGVFDMAIWHISRFEPPIIEHLLVGGKWNLADHFDISILLLAPIFWITERSEVLLIIQAIFAGLAGLVIYRIGIEVLKNKFLAFSIASCYFLFVGIQNAVITDFHELTIMTLTVALTFLFIVRKNVKLFWLFFLITLGFKEVTYPLAVGIAIFIFFYNRKWKYHALFSIIVSVIWGLLAMKVFIPYFSDGIYLHFPLLPESVSGKTLGLINQPIKRETLFFSGLQFGFLPLFAPSLWPAIIQDYIIRFIPANTTTYWSLGLHYNAVVSVLLAVASIFGLSNLLKISIFNKLKYLLAIFLFLNAIFLFRFQLHGPFLLAINPAFYAHTKDFEFLDKLVEMIPKNVSIMTQNNLGVRFTHQDFIFIREEYEEYAPDYILIDNREGQNSNNLLWAPSIPEFIERVKMDEDYTALVDNGAQYLFKRVNN
jgi:uncharacterized membrane protein